jgi:hypothetical protein
MAFDRGLLDLNGCDRPGEGILNSVPYKRIYWMIGMEYLQNQD